jgi:hypothetical protein
MKKKGLSNALFAYNMMLSLDVLIDIKHKAQTGGACSFWASSNFVPKLLIVNSAI